MNKPSELVKSPVATGDPWTPTPHDPASVPIPLPVIIVNVEGPYTEMDRKLWRFLLHAVWAEFGVNLYHIIPIRKISQVFRSLGGDHSINWIWE
jgi:hypothetical protein